MPSREPSGSTQPPGPDPAPAAVEADVALAMRASSWGDVGEYGRLLHAHEASSIHSGAGEHEEPLDPDVVVVGAGGVAHGPLPPTPSGSAGVLAQLAGLAPPYAVPADAMCHIPPPPLSPVVGGSRAIMQVSSYSSDGSDGDSDSFFARNSEEAARGAFSRAHLHPHAHAHIPHPGYRVGDGDVDDEDDDDDDGSGWGIGAIGAARRAKAGLFGATVDVEEECDYDEDEGSDEPAIEVRRRRPSWAVHHDEHEGDDEDDEDDPPPSPPPPPRGVEGESDPDEP